MVLNVTVTQPSAAGYLTVLPAGIDVSASNLDFQAHQTVANVATVQMTTGNITFHNGSSGTVHVVADLSGYYGAGGGNFASVAPLRVLDTRHAIGVPGTAPLGAHATATVDMSAAIPAGAQAVVLNMTATGGTSSGFLTAYPAGTPLPSTSSLNYTAGSTIANEVIVPVSAGKIKINNGSAGTVHVLADLMGWYGPASAGAKEQFVPYGPIRITDTRTSQPNPVPAHQAIFTYGAYATMCSPSCPTAMSFVFNVVATQPTAAGYLTVYPNAPTPPNTSTLNFKANQTVANAVTVRGIPTTQVYNASIGTVQVIVDEQGYFIDPTRGN